MGTNVDRERFKFFINNPPWNKGLLVPIVFYIIVYPDVLKRRFIKECSGNVMKDSLGKIVANNLLRGPRSFCLCRYCGKETDSNYQTFCDKVCVQEFQYRTRPEEVRTKLLERDAGICQICSFPAHEWYKKISNSNYDQAIKLLDSLESELSPVWRKKTSIIRSFSNWEKNLITGAESCKLLNSGMFWESAHILDVQYGGGVCGLEGYRLLCVPCHDKESLNAISRKSETLNSINSDLSAAEQRIDFVRNKAMKNKSDYLPSFITDKHLINFDKYVEFQAMEKKKIAANFSKLVEFIDDCDYDTIISNISDTDQLSENETCITKSHQSDNINSNNYIETRDISESFFDRSWTRNDKIDLIKLTTQYGKKWASFHHSYFLQFSVKKLCFKYNAMLKSGEYHQLLKVAESSELSDPKRFNTSKFDEFDNEKVDSKLKNDISKNEVSFSSNIDRRKRNADIVGLENKAKMRKPWTDTETKALLDGYELYGSKWATIKKKYSTDLERRSNVDLKDKFRVITTSKKKE
ncbi:DNA annealing helicase and endonuclease ZRANB3 [Smittium culicis]|uniref:DNA annealing helicase and endonuclease ZRANB3 n=1 Tax=Smittium culicis TaxID=133412 RepID=A0A1R1YBA2_9FUNG|nr:DNA annealing helicase and endonuclease ZRANB3 [Smittium culicis]